MAKWGPLLCDMHKVEAQHLREKLRIAMAALGDVHRFVEDLEPYADQGHTLVPALQKACAVYADLKGDTNDRDNEAVPVRNPGK